MSLMVHNSGGGKTTGKYAWKKYKNQAIYSYENPSFSTIVTNTGTSVSARKISVKDANFQLPQWDYIADLLEGFSLVTSAGTYEIYKDGNRLYTMDGVDEVSIEISSNASYDFVLKFGAMLDVGEQYHSFSYDGTKKIYEKVLKEYVVSENNTEYPNGGTKGGYWYEKLVESVIDHGTVTPSKNTNAITIRHKLGVVPSHVLIYVPNANLQISSWTSMVANFDFIANRSIGSLAGYGLTNTKNKLMVTFETSPSSPFSPNYTYHWIVIA